MTLSYNHPSDRFSPRSRPEAGVQQADGIDLGRIVAALRRQKWLIFACVLMSLIFAVVTLRNTKPSYYSSVEVLLNTRQERVVGIEQVVSDLNVTNPVVAGEIAVLQSNLLLGQVVDGLDLISHPEFDPAQYTQPGLISRATEMVRTGLAQIGVIQAPSEPMPDATTDGQAVLSAADARNLVIWRVRRNLSIYQSGISYVITISMSAQDPNIAAKIANAIANRYIRDQLDAKLQATQRAIAWLDNRLIELEMQLRHAEDAVVDFLAKQVLEEGGDRESVTQQLNEMNRAFVAARTERATAEARLSHIRSLVAQDGPEGAAAALDTPRLAALDAELADLGRQRAQLALRLGPLHPEMLSVQLALDDLLGDRVAAIRAAISEVEATVALAVGREKAIGTDIGQAQLLQVELSRSSVRLSQLERSASAMRQVYESFLARFQETTQQLEFQRADARLISEAQPALSPARPRKKLIVVVALVLGAVLGVALALVREVTDRRVRKAHDLPQLTGLPVLATLPQVRRRGRGGAWQKVQLGGRSHSGYAEGLRLLRFALHDERVNGRGHILLLTGVDWGVGCSSTVLGLARVLAAEGRRIAIVDANYRRPGQKRLLGLTQECPCVDAYFEGEATVADILQREVEPGLSFVPASSDSSAVSGRLSSTRFKALIDALAGDHDMVLIDGPPTIGMADTTALAAICDTTVLIARSGASRSADITDTVAALEEAGGHVLGTVLSHTEGGVATTVPLPASDRGTLRFVRPRNA